MSDVPNDSPASSQLPEKPNLDWLRKQARLRHREMRKSNPLARLAEAQFQLAGEYGFPSWRTLKSHIDSLTIEGQLIASARTGDLATLRQLLASHPEKLHVRVPPYNASLLFPAAQSGSTDVVSLLLDMGLDVNYREAGDNTTVMHWAAASGRLELVRLLVDAGGDVVGEGDDHQLQVIGWATCWNGCDDEAHRAVAEFLISRGARHHIFSAIAMNLPDEVKRIVSERPQALNSRMSRNESHQMPLHFAVRMNRPEMIALLLDLGADPLAVDGSGVPAPVYATNPSVDRSLMERIRQLFLAELDSAVRGGRRANVTTLDFVAALALRDWSTVGLLFSDEPDHLNRVHAGVLHILSKRGDEEGVKWLLEHGADADARWAHWDAEVTPLHLAALGGHTAVVGLLLQVGADASIRDSKHDSPPAGWAEYSGHPQVARILRREEETRRPLPKTT
jgi:ankyrin repeat protein